MNGRLAFAYLCSVLYLRAEVADVLGRSDIVLERPNAKPEEAMPLGNGRLGVAIWAADGLTVQLNRADTLPGRLSPGQVTIDGVAALTGAPDYTGRVNLYNGEFQQSGGGMKTAVWVEPDSDVAVVDVTGAKPDRRQTVTLRLWEPRKPHIEQSDGIVVLSETWRDATAAGATGGTFGSLAAVAARGRDVQVTEHRPGEAELSLLPERDGSFRVWIAAPSFGGGNALQVARSTLAKAQKTADSEHRRWWNAFWGRTGLLKLASKNGEAEYFENLRAIDLFLAAAESRDRLPGSQAGVGDVFSAARDFHKWDPAAYWQWNLRMQVAANLGAGLFDLNAPYFRLYRENLSNIERWTKERMEGRPGACVPETMRFNGEGFENEEWTKAPGRNCDAGSPPYYNARTISTGAEVSLWIWRQYLMTEDRAFLAENYPVLAAAARFLLAYSTKDADGVRHTFPSNAHENQWDVHDPTTDICAMRTLFPVVVQAAQILGRDGELAKQAEEALKQVRKLPVQNGVIGQSYDPKATVHNTENVGLEPVWPYALIGIAGAQHDVGVQTFLQRPNKYQNDWSYDPLDAARLGLADEMKTALERITEKYQAYPSGLAQFVGPEFYREQIGVVAAAMQEALAQEFDGVLYLAPAWPKEWDAEGTVFLTHGSRVHVRVSHGKVESAVFQAGYSGMLRYHIDAESALRVDKGQVYDLVARRSGAAVPRLEGVPAQRPKQLGSRTIGLLR